MMKREKAESANNIWNKEGFLMCGLGEKNKIIAKIKYFMKCCSWSRQAHCTRVCGLRQMEYVPVSAEPDPGYAAGSAE